MCEATSAAPSGWHHVGDTTDAKQHADNPTVRAGGKDVRNEVRNDMAHHTL